MKLCDDGRVLRENLGVGLLPKKPGDGLLPGKLGFGTNSGYAWLLVQVAAVRSWQPA